MAGQLDLLGSFIDDFAKTEVGDFDFAIMEDDVLRFQVKMNDALGALV